MRTIFIYTFLIFAFPDHANAKYQLHMGVHNIEYFADRMILKAKLLGFDGGKKVVLKKQPPLYKSYLVFSTAAEAEAAKSKILKKVPDAKLAIIEIK